MMDFQREWALPRMAAARSPRWRCFLKTAGMVSADRKTFVLRRGQNISQALNELKAQDPASNVTVAGIIAANGGMQPERFQAGKVYRFPESTPKPAAKPVAVRPVATKPAPKPVKSLHESTGWEAARRDPPSKWGYMYSCPHCGQKYKNPNPSWRKWERDDFTKKTWQTISLHNRLLHSNAAQPASGMPTAAANGGRRNGI